MPSFPDFFRRWFAGQGRSGLLLALSALWICATGNLAFFSLFAQSYPLQWPHLFDWLTVAVLLFCLLGIFLGLLAWGRATRPVLVVLLLISAVCAAFMDSYGVVLNVEMMRNAANTNLAESADLMNWRFVAQCLVTGVLPAVFVWRWQLPRRGWRAELAGRARLLATLLLLGLPFVFANSGFLASFARNDKAIRIHANPLYPVYAAVKFATEAQGGDDRQPPKKIGEDALVAPEDTARDLLVIVVGETARADHFGLNGYARDTTPELRRANVISLSQVESCGTSTAYSVPCMFSSAGAARYTPKGAKKEENLLDVLVHAGVHVSWLDNNSSSLGVASRVDYQDFRSPDVNPVCDTECRDEGMVGKIQEIVDRHPTGDVVIVLHQMGNHGPAYFKRYPESFERFKPACRDKDLGQCSQAQIINAYDNAIAYTDRFLGKVIEVLRHNDDKFETALFYFSDHGESLGENGIFLHGMPKAIAPAAQTHVPGILWFGSAVNRIDSEKLRAQAALPRSHDNIFHTVLGFLDIESEVYRPEMDILHGALRGSGAGGPGPR
ncbi:phosphoethanolamine transferase [Azonexus sp. R2A61]|uniref:phosphoethanolamine transferase n=1 Tax=Azonexus sp. R2A61 TaxID=2744443 RepID=UPI001F193983|nr:phosphoethanolamine--lipid A transferase [Azonexus sp. R2A61]